MKRLLLAAAMFGIALPATCQLNKSQWLTGGNGTFAHAKNKGSLNGTTSTNETTGLQATAGGAYFFMDQLAGGLRAGVSHSLIKQVFDARQVTPLFSYYSAKTDVTAFVISPFVRYYFFRAAGKINLVADVSYSYSRTRSKIETFQSYLDFNQMPVVVSSINTQKDNSGSYTLAAGPALFLNAKTSLELLLGYTHSKYSDSKLSGNAFSIEVGFQLHLTAVKKRANQ